KGNQLEGLAERMKAPQQSPCDQVTLLPPVKARDSFEILSTANVSKRRPARGVPLGDLVSEIRTGRTPPRSAYSDGPGLFLIKVGNLTGAGINWVPRDRNFIDTS